MIAGHIAALSSGLFAGASIYINLVEHPARLQTGPVRRWRSSHRAISARR
jgi:hypothetical protein